jgi:ADP-glucose pyrophosphorylase
VRLTGLPSIPYKNTLDKIHRCNFSGNIYIGVFLKDVTLQDGLQVPCGLYNSSFRGTCVFSDNCYVSNCMILSNVFLGRNSCLVNCDKVFCVDNTSFGTQKTICVGPETSSANMLSRSVTFNVTSSYYDVCLDVMTHKQPMGSTQSNLDSSLHLTGGKTRSRKAAVAEEHICYDLTIICDEVEIIQCQLKNVFIGSYSRVNMSTLDNCTLLSHCIISTSKCIDSVFHGSCSITDRCLVHSVLMFPQSHISAGAKVEESVLGTTRLLPRRSLGFLYS